MSETKYLCRESVPARQGFGYYACGNKALHDPDANGIPTHCGTHSLAAIERRKQRQIEDFKAYRRLKDAERALHKVEAELLPALEQIENGCNDPRALATVVLTRLRAAQAELKNAKEAKR